jgi:hypothetical protein
LEANLGFFTVAGAVLDFNELPDSRVSTHLKTGAIIINFAADVQ